MADVSFFPYGNARETKSSSGWDFSCQHGHVECEYNLVETCGINKIEDGLTRFNYISCVEEKVSGTNYDSVVSTCAKQAGVESLTQDILTCFKGSEGSTLEHAMAQATDSLSPSHQYVPWITVDGVHDTTKEDAIGDSLLDFVCANYTGPNKSKDCPSTKVFKKAVIEKCPVENNFL